MKSNNLEKLAAMGRVARHFYAPKEGSIVIIIILIPINHAMHYH
jgi:hypothetical protein